MTFELVREFRAVRMTGIKTGDPRPVVLKSGQWSLETVRLCWCPCDTCHVGMWVNEGDLKACWTCPTCGKTGNRKGSDEVPVCKGRTLKGNKIVHEAIEMTSEDPIPGRRCRMTPRCPGKHRKVSE